MKSYEEYNNNLFFVFRNQMWSYLVLQFLSKKNSASNFFLTQWFINVFTFNDIYNINCNFNTELHYVGNSIIKSAYIKVPPAKVDIFNSV